MAFNFSGDKTGVGLLFMRIGIAVFLIFHSVTRLAGSASTWKSIGKMMNFVDTGMEVKTVGLIILIFELIGGVGIASGYFFRIVSACMAAVFGLYTYHYYFVAGHTILPLYSFGFLMLCLGLALTGPGAYIIMFKSK
ncbi:MAG: DoxX family membrane protein [Deltaproteobacteria bacterium]|nr:DoxX family membrane protein [Deltaproteobacteria bacterium]